MNKIKIENPQDVIPVLKRWKNARQENFLTITLNGAHEVIKVNHITKGLVNSTIAHPRECFYPAIKDYASAVIFAHNHPSGYTKPSEEDKELTERLCLAGGILGIHVLDHIIFTKSGKIASLRSEGIIDPAYDKRGVKDYMQAYKGGEIEGLCVGFA